MGAIFVGGHMAPRACGGDPLRIGRLWQGIEAVFRGLIPLCYLSLRLRRSLVYGGFASSVWFRIRCWVFCAPVSFARLVI